MIALGHGCSELKAINLSGSRRVDDIGVIALASGCHALQTINLDSCSITNESLTALGAGCTQLETICLRGCMKIYRDGLKALDSGCENLKTIDVQDCLITMGISELKLRCNVLYTPSKKPQLGASFVRDSR